MTRVMGATHKFVMETALPYEGEECLIWPYAKNSAGYGHYRRDKKSYLVHRLVCRLKHGDPPGETYMALHKCGRGHEGCCNPNHLVWGTGSDNVQDRWNHGTFLHGERSPHAKLTDDQVLAIRADSRTQRVIALHYGTCQQSVSAIKRGKIWRHVL